MDAAGEAGGEAVAGEEFGYLVGAERGDADGGGAGAAQEPADGGAALDAFGHEDPHAGRGQAQGEAEQIGAFRIQPLGVVEDEQDGGVGGEGAEHLDDGEAQCDVVAAGAGRVGLAAQQGDGGALGSESRSSAAQGTEARSAAAEASGIHWSVASGARRSTVSWRVAAATATAPSASVLPAPAGPVSSARPCVLSARSTALISSPCPTVVSAFPVAATTHSHQPLGPHSVPLL